MIKDRINIEIKTSGYDLAQTATLDCFIPTTDFFTNKEKLRAVIICPGGGYHYCSSWEGEPIALRFFADGYATFVLNYSVSPARFPQSVCEAAAAVKIVRDNAQKWNIDPDKIIICGFSAGGHLAASLGMFYDKSEVLDVLKCTEYDCKPNGMILCYPVITSGEKAHKGSFNNLLGTEHTIKDAEKVSLEKLVTKKTPPAFIWHTFEDTRVPVENSILLFSEMKKTDISAELHIFPHGSHGLSLADGVAGPENNDVVIWSELASRWIKNL